MPKTMPPAVDSSGGDRRFESPSDPPRRCTGCIAYRRLHHIRPPRSTRRSQLKLGAGAARDGTLDGMGRILGISCSKSGVLLALVGDDGSLSAFPDRVESSALLEEDEALQALLD